jgi:UDP-N-acetylmuramyl pentapeptide phosphotransferase/UDP-N-acetylglucosamine-1-phosphate transferase
MFLVNKRKHYNFTERSHSVKGIVSSAVSLVILAGYVLMLVQAFSTNGALSMYYGSAGLALFILAVGMLVLAVISLFEEDSYPLFPRLALFLSLLAIACLGGTYALGLGLI